MDPSVDRPVPLVIVPRPDPPPAPATATSYSLTEEIDFLRAAIRRLVNHPDLPAAQLKNVVEIRHLVATLCTALKTDRELVAVDDPLQSSLMRVLIELGMGPRPLELGDGRDRSREQERDDDDEV